MQSFSGSVAMVTVGTALEKGNKRSRFWCRHTLVSSIVVPVMLRGICRIAGNLFIDLDLSKTRCSGY